MTSRQGLLSFWLVKWLLDKVSYLSHSGGVKFPVSVILPTFEPRKDYLERVLEGLSKQSLPKKAWELVVVDNGSLDPGYLKEFDLQWHSDARLVREERSGLTHARIRGIRESVGELIVFVDDDNLLRPDYLQQAINTFHEKSNLGALGGKSQPEYEDLPAPWIEEFQINLALRDLGEKRLFSGKVKDPTTLSAYPDFSPIGAGMILRRKAAHLYVESIDKAEDSVVLDRCGTELSSGGDNDIVLTVVKAGWSVGYDPKLVLTHLIPRERLARGYLGRVSYASSLSWVQVLRKHGIEPWDRIPAWSAPLRKVKAYFLYHAWRDDPSFVRWRAACGLYDGLREE